MEEKKIFGLHRNVFAAGLVSFFMDISSEMVYPLVPLFLVGVIGTTKTTVGIIEGIAESTASLLKVFSGWLSDVTGKRKLLMTAGYATSAISRPILGIASSWGLVLTARFIDRFGKGVRTSPRDAIIADSTEPGSLGKAFGFHRAMDTAGAIIGPALATVLLLAFSGDMRPVFFLSAVPAVIAVFLILIFIKEKKSGGMTPVTRPRSRELYRPTLSGFDGPRLKRYIAVIAIFSLGAASDFFLILRAENLGVKKELIPLLYVSFNMVYAISSAPLGALADRVGIKKVIFAGFILYSAIYAAFAVATNPTQIWGIFLAYGVYKGISDGAQRAYVATLAPPEKLGTAFGMYHTASGLMLLPASIIGGVLWDKMGPSATFLYASSLSLLAAAIFIIPVKNKR